MSDSKTPLTDELRGNGGYYEAMALAEKMEEVLHKMAKALEQSLSPSPTHGALTEDYLAEYNKLMKGVKG